MTSDTARFLQRAVTFAEQATSEDRAGNHEAAVRAYLSAIEYLMHAVKYGALNDELKKTARAKVAAYLKRAEELQRKMNTPPAPVNVPITEPDVMFDDVVGLEQAKMVLKKEVILPVKHPKLFQGNRNLSTGILLYGPPGTGKSLLAKAVAAECKDAFIGVHAGGFLSRRDSESESRVRNLFENVRKRRPCVLFIDDFEALSDVHQDDMEENVKCVLTEILMRMQDVGNTSVRVLVATNRPWELHTAIRRRLEKCIYIPLPQLNERIEMFKKNFEGCISHTIQADEWTQFGHQSEHYSGADITVVCREAILRPIRHLHSATHFKQIPNETKDENQPSHLWLACSPEDPDAREMNVKEINPDELYEPPVTLSDVLTALETKTPSVSEADLAKFTEFTTRFNQDGV